jgi:hypothetical protein
MFNLSAHGADVDKFSGKARQRGGDRCIEDNSLHAAALAPVSHSGRSFFFLLCCSEENRSNVSLHS